MKAAIGVFLLLALFAISMCIATTPTPSPTPDPRPRLNVGDVCTGRNYRECQPATTDACTTYYCNKEASPHVCASRPSSGAIGKPCGTSTTGACQMGVLTCDPGTGHLACTGAVYPVAEIIGNSVDDNCDGIVE